MAARMIDLQHRITGVKARLPESALDSFPDYLPTTKQARRDAAASQPFTPMIQAIPPIPDAAPAGKES